MDTKDELGQTVLHYVARTDDVKFIQYVIGVGANVNVRDNRERTPLFYAIEKGSEEVVQAFINNKNTDVMARDQDGLTPLHVAVQVGRFNIIKCLCETGVVDINARDNKGRTPLFYAIEEKNNLNIE